MADTAPDATTQQQQPSATAAAPSGAGGDSKPADVDVKIVGDLDVVSGKIDVVENMLKSPMRIGSDGKLSLSGDDDALLNAIGFLEACAPRLVELVEAAAQGALSSEAALVSGDRGGGGDAERIWSSPVGSLCCCCYLFRTVRFVLVGSAKKKN